MPSLSQMKVSARTNHEAVMRKFESVRALDNNPMFDQDPEEGSVALRVDGYTPTEAIAQDLHYGGPAPSLLTASAKFKEDGTPLEMEWKTTRENERANKEMDAPVVEHTASISTEGENTVFSSSYYGPTMYGEFEHGNSQSTILNSNSGTLVDFSMS